MGAVWRELEQVGGTRGSCPEVCEIFVEHWVPLVEGVQVEDVVIIGFTQRDGESQCRLSCLWRSSIASARYSCRRSRRAGMFVRSGSRTQLSK